MDWYKLEYRAWSDGYHAGYTRGPRYAPQSWTPAQRMAYDTGYDAGASARAIKVRPKPHGWRPKNTIQPTRWS